MTKSSKEILFICINVVLMFVRIANNCMCTLSVIVSLRMRYVFVHIFRSWFLECLRNILNMASEAAWYIVRGSWEHHLVFWRHLRIKWRITNQFGSSKTLIIFIIFFLINFANFWIWLQLLIINIYVLLLAFIFNLDVWHLSILKNILWTAYLSTQL